MTTNNKTNTERTVEEIVEEFERQMPLMRAHGKLLCATASPTTYKKIKDWLRQALTEAHQTGIDEEKAKVKEMVQEINGKMYFDHERLREYIKDDTIKALQDNK